MPARPPPGGARPAPAGCSFGFCPRAHPMPHLRKSPRTVSKDLRIAAVKGSAGTARWQAGSVNTEGAGVEHNPAPVSGWCAAGWERVRVAFAGKLAKRSEVGAADNVNTDGWDSVDLHGGGSEESGENR